MDAFNNCTTASRARVHVKISDQDAANIVNLQTLGVTDALESLSMGQCYNTDSIGGQPNSIVQNLQNATKKKTEYDKPTLMFVDDGIDSIEIKDMPKLYKKKRAIPGKENKQPCLEYKRQCRIKTPVKIKNPNPFCSWIEAITRQVPLNFFQAP